jgi:hypothetical protein
VHLLPDAEELHGVAIAQPVGDEEVPVFGLEHVGQRDEIPVAVGIDRDGRALHFDLGHVQLSSRAASWPN